MDLCYCNDIVLGRFHSLRVMVVSRMWESEGSRKVHGCNKGYDDRVFWSERNTASGCMWKLKFITLHSLTINHNTSLQCLQISEIITSSLKVFICCGIPGFNEIVFQFKTAEGSNNFTKQHNPPVILREPILQPSIRQVVSYSLQLSYLTTLEYHWWSLLLWKDERVGNSKRLSLLTLRLP